MGHEIISNVYSVLLNAYGPQGWWPVYTLRDTEGRDERGYAQRLPVKLSPLSRFEIAAGAVLTQNTSWFNVEKTIDSLFCSGLLDPVKIRDVPQTELAASIRQSGYYNQKARKLKNLAAFLLDGEYLQDGKKDGKIPDRDALLGLWGIGKETADSILLYAYGVPFFVVDTYTKRIFNRLGVLTGDEKYDEIAEKFSSCFKSDVAVFQDYHALIVRHAKEHCRKKPECSGCVLKESCLLNLQNNPSSINF